MQFTHSNQPQTLINHNLFYAQQKLTLCDVPLQIKAVSYVRLCCQAMADYHRDLQKRDLAQAHEWNLHIPYLNLLGRLQQVKSEWWTTCFVDEDGLLDSNHKGIHLLLNPLNTFFKAQYGHRWLELQQMPTRQMAIGSPLVA